MKPVFTFLTCICLCACKESAPVITKVAEEPISIEGALNLTQEIDRSISFTKTTGQTSKGQTVSDLRGWKSRLTDVDVYDAKLEKNGIKLTIQFRTYEDPKILDSGKLSIKYKANEFTSKESDIKELAEKYVSGFIKGFVDIPELRDSELKDIYTLRPSSYVPSAKTTEYKGYYIDTYRRQDFVDWKTHETITFTIE